jgi:hypothetical protein
MKTKVQLIQANNQFFIQRHFESKCLAFELRMLNQVVDILAPFVAFVTSYHILTMAHNILIIMLDPQFKSMKTIQNFVGNVF